MWRGFLVLSSAVLLLSLVVYAELLPNPRCPHPHEAPCGYREAEHSHASKTFSKSYFFLPDTILQSALPSDGFIKSDDAVELFDLVDADTSHSFERCHINVIAGCDDILQDGQFNSYLKEQPTLTVIALSCDVLERRRDDVGDDVRVIPQRMKLRILLNRLCDILAFASATVLFVVLIDELHRGLIRVEGEPDAPVFVYRCVFF